MMRIALSLPLIALLAACSSEPGSETSAPAEPAREYTAELEACGLEKVSPLVWGMTKNQNDFTVQQVRAEDARNIRVWGENDAMFANTDGVLTAEVTGRAWIASDTARARAFMLYLDGGEASLRLEQGALQCVPNAELAEALAGRQTLDEQTEAAAEARRAQRAAEADQDTPEDEAEAEDGAAAQDMQESEEQ